MDDYKNKWISVKDKLPNDIKEICPYDFVLVYAEECDKGGFPSMHGIAQEFEGKWEIIGNEGGCMDVGAFEFKSEYVTHWKILDRPK